jgi:hypothetical protein
LPYRQMPRGALTFYSPKELVVRSSADPSTLIPAIRRSYSKGIVSAWSSLEQLLQPVVNAGLRCGAIYRNRHGLAVL